MGHFGATCRALREARHLSMAQLAKLAGINKDTIWRAENMDEPRMQPLTFRKLAAGLGVRAAELDHLWQRDDGTQLTTGLVAGFDGIPASPPRFVQFADESECDFHISRKVIEHSGVTDPFAYTLVVRGNSMAPTILDGEIVIVSPTVVQENGVESGKVYAVWLACDEGATLKRVQVLPEQWKLIPDNPEFETTEVDPQMITSMALVAGKMSVFEALAENVAARPVVREADPELAGEFNGGRGAVNTVEGIVSVLSGL